jgi:hypothetical protein
VVIAKASIFLIACVQQALVEPTESGIYSMRVRYRFSLVRIHLKENKVFKAKHCSDLGVCLCVWKDMRKRERTKNSNHD